MLILSGANEMTQMGNSCFGIESSRLSRTHPEEMVVQVVVVEGRRGRAGGSKGGTKRRDVRRKNLWNVCVSDANENTLPNADTCI